MNLNTRCYSSKPEMMEIQGNYLVKNFGNLPIEYDALRHGAVIYDCGSYGLYFINGDNSEAFLEKLSTKDVGFMNIGNITECYFLDENANIIGDVTIVRLEVGYLVLAHWEFSNSVLAWMEKQAKIYNVHINDLSEKRSILSIEGCQSWKVLKILFEAQIQNISLHTFQDIEFQQESIIVMRIGRTSEYGYTIISPSCIGEKIYADFLLLKSKVDFPIAEIGFDCLELAMLEVRQPNFFRKTADLGNIFELSQQWYIRYDKEDYFGCDKVRELATTEINKSSVGFVYESNFLLDVGTIVYADGVKVGIIAYSMYSLALKQIIGIAVLQEPYAQSGLTLVIKKSPTKELKTISAPFVRPLSWDLKME